MLAVAYYILKVIICSGILYGYYRLALHNKLFHRWNRFYLLAAVVMSLSFPLIKINIWHLPSDDDGQVIKLLNVVTTGDELVFEASQNGQFHITGEQGVSLLYLLVSLILFVLLVNTLIKLNKLVRQHHVQKIQQINFVDTEAKGTPFSFFRYIFWNHHIDLNSPTGTKIFLHELAHVKEKHSADRLFMNIVLIFFWCNPFFWLIRREMNMIHEFIADSKAVEDNDTSAFAAMILQAAYPQQAFGLTSNFFNSSIKRRLLMLTKMKNPRVSYIGRILALPLLTCIFLAFTVKTKQNIQSGEVIKTIAFEKSFIVVIDAGHGGDDAGAKSTDGQQEKDITLSLAKKIQQLNNNSSLKIILTREADLTKPVRERVDYVLTQKPDAFISIHVAAKGAVENPGTEGFEIFISRKANPNEAKTKLLASVISQEIAKTYTIAPDLKQRKEQGVWVLDAPTINYPSILIECGYITDKKDLAFITNEANQEKIANDILKGIERFAKERETNAANLQLIDNNTAAKGEEILSGDKINNNTKKSGVTSILPAFQIKEVRIKEVLKDTLPADIKSVDLTRDDNVIIIHTDNKAEKITRAEAEKRGIVGPPQPNITLRGAKVDSALCFIDGVEMPISQISKLDPQNIESVTVLKGYDAIDRYGLKAVNGVVEVTLKKDKVATAMGRPANGNDKENDLDEIVVVGYQSNRQNNIFEEVEIKAAFPGGEGAWTKYMARAINKNIGDLLKAGDTGTCMVQFVVEKDGTVSDIRALTMQGSRLAEIVIDGIKNGPKWIPAVKDGTNVRSYRKQPVTFQRGKG